MGTHMSDVLGRINERLAREHLLRLNQKAQEGCPLVGLPAEVERFLRKGEFLRIRIMDPYSRPDRRGVDLHCRALIADSNENLFVQVKSSWQEVVNFYHGGDMKYRYRGEVYPIFVIFPDYRKDYEYTLLGRSGIEKRLLEEE